MAYKQLVSPNLNTVGHYAECLAYARQMFHAPGGVDFAWDAWLNAKYKHQDKNLPDDVAVPVWFSYVFAGRNEGHVAVHVPGRGFYSSPYTKTGSHAVLGTIDDIEHIYGVKYVGWTEDINGVRVAEPVVTPAPASSPLAKYVGHVVHLEASAGTWRVYAVGSTVPRIPVAILKPGKFHGLSYTILAADKSPNSVVIQTADFGKVSLPIASDNKGTLYPTANVS